MHKAARIKSQKLHGGNTCRCLKLQSEFEWCRADATLYLEKKYTQASHAEMLNCSVNVNLRTSVTLKAKFFGRKNGLLPKVNFNFLFETICWKFSMLAWTLHFELTCFCHFRFMYVCYQWELTRGCEKMKEMICFCKRTLNAVLKIWSQV